MSLLRLIHRVNSRGLIILFKPPVFYIIRMQPQKIISNNTCNIAHSAFTTCSVRAVAEAGADFVLFDLWIVFFNPEKSMNTHNPNIPHALLLVSLLLFYDRPDLRQVYTHREHIPLKTRLSTT